MSTIWISHFLQIQTNHAEELAPRYSSFYLREEPGEPPQAEKVFFFKSKLSNENRKHWPEEPSSFGFKHSIAWQCWCSDQLLVLQQSMRL